MRTSEVIDYEVVLADLRDRRAKIDAAIVAIEELVLGRPVKPPSEPRSSSHDMEKEKLPTKVESDTFFKLSATDAAAKYLRMKKKPASTKEVEKALLEGGFLTSAKNFYANIYTAMMRSDDFVKIKKKWGLAEWYPGKRMENSQTKEETADRRVVLDRSAKSDEVDDDNENGNGGDVDEIGDETTELSNDGQDSKDEDQSGDEEKAGVEGLF